MMMMMMMEMEKKRSMEKMEFSSLKPSPIHISIAKCYCHLRNIKCHSWKLLLFEFVLFIVHWIGRGKEVKIKEGIRREEERKRWKNRRELLDTTKICFQKKD